MSYLLDSWSCPLDTAWPEQLNTISLCLFLFIRINTHVLVTFFSCRAFFSRVTSGSSAFVIKQYYIFRSARTSYEYQQKFLLLQFNLFFSPSVQREWVLDNREVKSEEKIKKYRSLLPGSAKWNKNAIHSFREVKVK